MCPIHTSIVGICFAVSFLGSLPYTSLPHTPSVYNNLTHNLADLNDKLLALSQKMQGEQLEEARCSGDNESLTPTTYTHPPATPITHVSATAALPAATALPTQSNVKTGALTPGKASATPEAGVLHVDTLNGLADALQKVINYLNYCSSARVLVYSQLIVSFQVIHVEPRETGSVPPVGAESSGHVAPILTDRQSPNTASILHAGVAGIQDVSAGTDRVSYSRQHSLWSILVSFSLGIIVGNEQKVCLNSKCELFVSYNSADKYEHATPLLLHHCFEGLFVKFMIWIHDFSHLIIIW